MNEKELQLLSGMNKDMLDLNEGLIKVMNNLNSTLDLIEIKNKELKKRDEQLLTRLLKVEKMLMIHEDNKEIHLKCR